MLLEHEGNITLNRNVWHKRTKMRLCPLASAISQGNGLLQFAGCHPHLLNVST